MAKKKKYKIAVIDFETDPFLFGRVPEPFCVEFFDGEIQQQFWGDDCADQLLNYLCGLKEAYLIYAHNGGKFDFHFLHAELNNPALIIKNRIVEACIFHHKVRDSYSILPVPLRDYSKMEFDYNKMERTNREKYKSEILEYLHDDCKQLFTLVSAFIERFGPKMTIGGTAIKEVEKYHSFKKQGSRHDQRFRPFYCGGRVQCFKGGLLKGPWKLIDVNSMYPFVMKNKLHPINGAFSIEKSLPDNFDMPFFARIRGINRNALPYRADNGSLIFNHPEGWFNVVSHELEIALKYNLFDIQEIDFCYLSHDAICFDEFVDIHYKEKSAAKNRGDKISELFSKLLLNSAYGRTGINPENFEDWYIHRDFGNDGELENEGYQLQVDYDNIELWSKPAIVSESQYCDVSIAASITSAARAVLMEGLQKSVDPIYCDTDSIICRDFSGDMDSLILGAWDLEKTAEYAAIAGKKMYALTDDLKLAKKLSSKGGTLDLAEIIRLCNDETVDYENAAPSFSLKKPPSFVSRQFRKTLDLP